MVKIRYAEYSDKEYWFSVDQHMPESEFEYKVQTKRAYILCLNDKPTGLLRYNLFWDNTPFCTLLLIEEEYQRKGYGTAMIRFLEERYRGQYGILQVGTGDSPLTVPFYEACGFRRSHTVKNFFTEYYDHPIYEAGVLLKDMVYLRKKMDVG